MGKKITRVKPKVYKPRYSNNLTCITCPSDNNSKPRSQFYTTTLPIYPNGYLPWCKECVINSALSKDKDFDLSKFKKMLQTIDKPFKKELLINTVLWFKDKYPHIELDEVYFYGEEIVKQYIHMVNCKKLSNSRYEDSDIDNTNTNDKIFLKNILKEVQEIENENNNISTQDTINSDNDIDYGDDEIEKKEKEEIPLVYSEVWMGEYTQSDIDKLDNYYKGLERDYSIVTENHKGYARKIAKASLWCDKCLNDMINGVDGADDKYQTALKSFDSLSKSAKFSESTRSVADIGLNSISRITDLVEAHNWIPKHTPVEKDDIDTLLDLIPKTIKKSF